MKHHESIESVLIHSGIYGDERTGMVSTPIYQASAFMQDELEKHRGYEYLRTGNPTREVLEALITELEGGEVGFAFASGMAVIIAALSLSRSGGRIVIFSSVYGGTFHVLDQIFRHFGFVYTIVDTTDLKALEVAITSSVKAVLVESLINPLLTVTDLAAIAEITHHHDALLIAGNTLMTLYLQRPLKLGADIVLHSATKYLDGHNDVIVGLAVVETKGLAERLHFIQNATGGTSQPPDSYLLIRNTKTLGVRMDRHMENAGALARLLRDHEVVKTVYYPGLPDAQDFEINGRQAKNGGAMISFGLNEGYDIRRLFQNLRLIALAGSLDGAESLTCHPASMTHTSISREICQKIGITDGLIRLSVGTENPRDLIQDLRMSMEGVKV